MRRIILSLFVSIGIVMSVSMPISAASLTKQLDNQKKLLTEQQNSYNKIQMNFEKLETSIEMLDSDIEGIYATIDKAKYAINDTEEKIEQTIKDIGIAQNNIKDEEALFNQRMRVMFINGTDSYLEILFDSEGIEDLFSRVENVKKIIEYDNKIISELNENKKSIEDKKESLNDNKIKVLALKADNEDKLNKLTIVKAEQNALIVEAKKQQELHKNEIAETQALLISTTNQIEEAAIQASKYKLAMAAEKSQEKTSSRGEVSKEKEDDSNYESGEEANKPQKPSSISSNEVVAYAENFLGTPYVWAANGPSTFDCSGFVQYVYANFGVSTGRSTYDQITHGEFVSREDLQPGDLVFFGSGSPHHVGIYVGNNSYIHAPRTGDVVKISGLTRSDYMSARRVK